MQLVQKIHERTKERERRIAFYNRKLPAKGTSSPLSLSLRLQKVSSLSFFLLRIFFDLHLINFWFMFLKQLMFLKQQKILSFVLIPFYLFVLYTKFKTFHVDLFLQAFAIVFMATYSSPESKRLASVK